MQDLRDIKQMIEGLSIDTAPPTQVYDTIKTKIEDLILQIRHPKQKVWLEIPYKSLDKNFRSKIKAIARYELEYARISKFLADMTFYIGKINRAVKTGRMSRKVRRVVRTRFQV
jgi:hypothetical protein